MSTRNHNIAQLNALALVLLIGFAPAALADIEVEPDGLARTRGSSVTWDIEVEPDGRPLIWDIEVEPDGRSLTWDIEVEPDGRPLTWDIEVEPDGRI